MRRRTLRIAPTLIALGLVFPGTVPVRAADPEIDRLLQSPVGKDWVTNGGNLTNQRYSTLKQIDTSNVKQLKGAWMTRLKGSGLGGKYSLKAKPLVKDGIMYMVTGNDDVFALNAKTGEILWEHWSGIGQTISTVCCGWLNRGLAMGEGMLFLGQLELWRFQTGFGADAPPVVYEVNGEEYVAIATGGNQLQASANGDAVWVFSLNGMDRLLPQPS
jgi:alcohol dehydrogenase (cytochrome c)